MTWLRLAHCFLRLWAAAATGNQEALENVQKEAARLYEE